MTTALHWRAYVISTGDNTRLFVPALELLGAGGNLATTGNGTASALRSTGGYPPSYAFDSDAATEWRDDNTGIMPNWLQWTFNSPQEIVGFTWQQALSMQSACATSIKLQSSDDGITWTDRLGPVTPPYTVGAITTFLIPATGTIAAAAPAPALASAGGGNVALVAPQPTLTAYSGANPNLAAPGPTLFSLGHDSTGERAAGLTAPSPTLAITTGANAKLSNPGPTLSATGTVTVFAAAALEPPSPTLSAAATVTVLGSATLTAPGPNLIGYSGAVCSITLTDGYTVQAAGTTGLTGGARITAPLFELTASGTAQNYGSANLSAPAARLGAQAQAYLVAPGAILTAVGTAVVTATYEAYALNLNHTPRKGNEVVNDEMTRYTNFPFTHVVRYQNSYFGANSTGLYLLEGTTDDGAPIEWGVKTAYTDFDSAQLKTVEMAYFGGRLGPETTITLFPGEVTATPHAHTTPRGTAAQNYRQPFGRGQKSRYYALGMSGEDAMAIDSITLNVATLARKV